MRGSFCFSHVLKVELRYLSSMYCFRVGRFASVGAHGRRGWSVGGKDRDGQLHDGSSGLQTPLFEQGMAVDA